MILFLNNLTDTYYYGKPNFKGDKPHEICQYEKTLPIKNF